MFLFIFLLLTSNAFAENFQGKLLERGTKNPMAAVNVFVVNSAGEKQKTVSNDKGEFEFINLPKPPFKIIVNSTNYQKYEKEFNAPTSIPKTLYIERENYSVFETVIVDKAKTRDTSLRSMKRAEILKQPGSAGDPLRAIQNLPGVNRPQSLSSQIVLQGSGPQDTQYLLNGHAVPLVFHFGGLSSVILPEAVEQVDLLQAGYGTEWGRAIGGLINVHTRHARKDRMHGLGFIDTFNAGFLLEAPTGKDSSVMIAARQSYIGQVLRPILKKNSSFDLTVVPVYRDLNLTYETKLSDKTNFEWSNFYSQDELQFLLKEPLKSDPTIRGVFTSKTAFYRTIPQIKHRFNETTSLDASIGFGRDWIKFINSSNYFSIKNDQLSARFEVEKKWAPFWTSHIGIDNIYRWTRVDISLPAYYSEGGVSNPVSSGTRREVGIFDRAALTGTYLRNEFQLSGVPLQLFPSLRIDHFKTGYLDEWHLSPRPAIRYKVSESLSLRSSGGLYFQPPRAQEVSSGYGNPDLTSPRAWHSTLGFEKDFRSGTNRGTVFTADAFYKNLQKQVISSSKYITRNGVLTPENYNNNGTGNVFGIQTQTKIQLEPWNLNLIYTLSRSRRSQPGKENYPSAYDQTHLIGLLASVDLGGNWSFGSRLRYSTGTPFTPVVSAVFDSDNDVFIPIRGTAYSDRLPAFMQLDARIDKKWVFDTWILSAYLDILNLTNRKNSEDIVYAYDYSKSTSVTGLPILPTFGIKAEF